MNKETNINLFSTFGYNLETMSLNFETGFLTDNLSKKEISTRIFYMAIKWAKTIRSFYELEERDQVKKFIIKILFSYINLDNPFGIGLVRIISFKCFSMEFG